MELDYWAASVAHKQPFKANAGTAEEHGLIVICLRYACSRKVGHCRMSMIITNDDRDDKNHSSYK